MRIDQLPWFRAEPILGRELGSRDCALTFSSPGTLGHDEEMTVIKINASTVPADSGDELAPRFAARAGADTPPMSGLEQLEERAAIVLRDTTDLRVEFGPGG